MRSTSTPLRFTTSNSKGEPGASGELGIPPCWIQTLPSAHRPGESGSAVAEMNKHREQYVRRHWNRHWLAPENYHLCIDTGWLGIDGASDLVLRITRQHFSLPTN